MNIVANAQQATAGVKVEPRHWQPVSERKKDANGKSGPMHSKFIPASEEEL
jgi:hypothetical protein